MVFLKGEMCVQIVIQFYGFKDNENLYFYCILFLFLFCIGIDLGI